MPSSSPHPLIAEKTGDLFTAPSTSILLHACNCRGSWGAGVAAAFKSKYPHAYQRYHTHCTSPPQGMKVGEYQKGLLGSCLLIPPCKGDAAEEQRNRGEDAQETSTKPQDTENVKDQKNGIANEGGRNEQKSGTNSKGHWIACLFTSVSYGRGVGKPGDILAATESAVKDLRRHIDDVQRWGKEVGDVWAVRINSGLFNVPWEDTLAVLEKGGVPMTVVRPPDDEKGKDDGSKGRGKKRSSGGGDGGRGRGGTRGVKRARGGGGLDGWLKS